MLLDAQDKVISATIEGIAEAKSTYSLWTGNCGYFAWAPEYLITVSVARTLAECCSWLTVWPEYRLGDALRDAGMSGHSAASRIGGNRRADLLLCWGDSRPRAVIEVKRNVESWHRIAADVDRLRSLMTRGDRVGSFELGMVAFNSTIFGDGRDRTVPAVLQNRLMRVADMVDDLSIPGWDCGFRSRHIEFDGHEYWSAAAVVLQRKGAGGRVPPRPSGRGAPHLRLVVS